ncbi:hypothetical protein J5751_01085 [bacterium]|nr:hypothetical protein [bacterium]
MVSIMMNKLNKYIRIMDNHSIEKDKIINIDSCDFITPVFLAPLMNFTYNNKKSIKHHKNPKVDDYLQRVLGLKKHKDTTLPFRWLDETTDNSEELTKDILQIIQPKKEMSQALKYIFYELINNVYDHSKFDNGFVIGQNYPRTNNNDFCFMDNGISIPGSFKNYGFTFKNDCEAIIKAVNGLSTKHGKEFIGRGTGLNTVINIVTQGANGNVIIASGTGVVEITKSQVYAKHVPENYIGGTLVGLRLNSNKSVNVYGHMKGIEYKLPKKIKVRKRNI